MTAQTFRQWLEMKFLEWQRNQGGRKTVMQFADYLGVGRTTLSMWWNKDERTPEGDNIRKLADKLGLEVYDVLGLPRPDAALFYIQKHWDDLPSEAQKRILDQAEGYLKKHEQSKRPTIKRPKEIH